MHLYSIALRLVALAALALWGCSGAATVAEDETTPDPAGEEATGTPDADEAVVPFGSRAMPEDCPPDELEVEVSGEDFDMAMIAVSGSPGRVVLHGTSAGAMHHTVTFYTRSTPEAGRIVFPSDAVVFDYQRSHGEERLWVANDEHVGGSAEVGTGFGSITYLHVGNAPGETTCATFDVQIGWADGSARLRGSFGVTLSETTAR